MSESRVETVDSASHSFTVDELFEYNFAPSTSAAQNISGTTYFSFHATGSYSTTGDATTLTGDYTVDYTADNLLIEPETTSASSSADGVTTSSSQTLHQLDSYSFSRSESGGTFTAGPTSATSNANFQQTESASYSSTSFCGILNARKPDSLCANSTDRPSDD